MINTINLFCSNIFLIFLVFVACRTLFYLFFNYRLSIIFREFSFWPYFIIMILDGNLQYLTYLMSFEVNNFFSPDFINKMALCISVCLYYILFVFSISVYFILKNFYGKSVKYFM